MIKMIAQRLHYHPDDAKEYKAGEAFHVANEREAERLERRHKAMRVTGEMEKPAHVDLPKKQMEAETPKKSGGRGRYQRRDMTATDGQTGEEIPLPSSLLAPPSEESTSTESEAEPEQ